MPASSPNGIETAMHTYIDLRSDTVTTPTPEMMLAIAAASVGDDGRLLPDGHYGDPTVRALEERAAELLGKPSALFVSTGVQANMIALRVWCEREDLVGVGRTSHLLRHERGAFDERFFGLRSSPLPDDDGFPNFPEGEDISRFKLLCLENTHNAAGGVAWLPDRATTLSLERPGCPPIHLDGARLFNAAVALDITPAEVASAADSVMFCLSKGLGAPVGSVLAGDEEWIKDARRVRRIIGGQMRQAGVIAAAGLVALDGFSDRLKHDHERAKALAHQLARLPGLEVDLPVVTNIIRVKVRTGPDAGGLLLQEAATHGVLLGGPKNGELRLVTHRDITDESLDRAVSVIGTVLTLHEAPQ
jgi:threonine aldolase